MTKEANITKAVYKGSDHSYIVILESEEAVKEWQKDSSIPLTQVVQSFDVFIGQGAQGVLDRPSKQQLENEFGTSNTDEIVKVVISKGKVETSKASSHSFGSTNDSKGAQQSGGR